MCFLLVRPPLRGGSCRMMDHGPTYQYNAFRGLPARPCADVRSLRVEAKCQED